MTRKFNCFWRAFRSSVSVSVCKGGTSTRSDHCVPLEVGTEEATIYCSAYSRSRSAVFRKKTKRSWRSSGWSSPSKVRSVNGMC